MNSRNLPSVWSVGNFFIREDCKNWQKEDIKLSYWKYLQVVICCNSIMWPLAWFQGLSRWLLDGSGHESEKKNDPNAHEISQTEWKHGEKIHYHHEILY